VATQLDQKRAARDIYIYDFVVLLLFFLSANKGLQSNELEMEGGEEAHVTFACSLSI
jgi:hypothetical protein